MSEEMEAQRSDDLPKVTQPVSDEAATGTSDPEHDRSLGPPNHGLGSVSSVLLLLTSTPLAPVNYLTLSNPDRPCFSIINRKIKTAEDKCKCRMFLTDRLKVETAFSGTI